MFVVSQVVEQAKGLINALKKLQRSVSINDVAKEAGVSNASVSRVLSKHPSVTEEMRARVQEAVRTLGYRKDHTAQRLRAQTASNVIGLITRSIQDPHFSAITQAVSDYAFEHQLTVILCNTNIREQKEHHFLELMESERAAGLLISPKNSMRDFEALERLRGGGTAIVLFDSGIDQDNFDLVQTDNIGGAYSGVRHLIDTGRRQVGIVTGFMELSSAKQRLEGYTLALSENNLDHGKYVRYGDYSEASGYIETVALLKLRPEIDSLFISNHEMTLGALKALSEAGKAIPTDVALVSFDDLSWFERVTPSLTAVRQPSYAIGHKAVECLIKRMASPDLPRQKLVLPTQLIVRSSSATD